MKRLAPKRSMSRRDARYMAAVASVLATIGTSRVAAALDCATGEEPRAPRRCHLVPLDSLIWGGLPSTSHTVEEGSGAGCSVAAARSKASPSADSSSSTLALLCFLVALGLARRALLVERPRCAKSDVRSRPRYVDGAGR